MLRSQTLRAAFRVCATAALVVLGLPVRAEEPDAYSVEVADVTAKVGDPAVMVATLRIRDGYRILEAYRNRVGSLSSLDEGVVFDQKSVPARLEDGALVFSIGLHASKPGKHPINGVFRVGYIQSATEMAVVSMRLIANVTGAE